MSSTAILYLIYSSLITIGQCFNKLVDIPILSFYYTERIAINVGSPPQTIQVSMDLNSNCSWFFERHFKNYTSNSMKTITNSLQITLEKYNQSLNGNYIEDLFFFDENEDLPITLPFILIADFPTDYYGLKGVVAFPLKFNDERNSIVHIFKERGLIDSLSFGIRRNKKQNLLRIGGLAEEDTFNKSHSYFDVIGQSHRWDFNVRQGTIQLGSEKKIFKTDCNSNYGYLDTTDEIMSVPTGFFDLIIDHFNASINKQLCALYIFNDKRRQLNCYELVSLRIGKIIIEIGNYQYTMQLSDLWICESDDDCEFAIMDDPLNNSWKFGSRFYFKTNVLFDYGRRQVHFYANKSDDIKEIDHIENAIDVPGLSSKLSVGILIFAMALLVIGVVILIITTTNPFKTLIIY